MILIRKILTCTYRVTEKDVYISKKKKVTEKRFENVKHQVRGLSRYTDLLRSPVTGQTPLQLKSVDEKIQKSCDLDLKNIFLMPIY